MDTIQLSPSSKEVLKQAIKRELYELDTKREELLRTFDELEGSVTVEIAATAPIPAPRNKNKKTRNTGLLQAVYNTLKEAKKPLTSSEVYKAIKEDFPRKGKERRTLINSMNSMLNTYSSEAKGWFDRVEDEGHFIYTVKSGALKTAKSK